jgi:uncharacterized membrane protein (UPF0182 family)
MNIGNSAEFDIPFDVRKFFLGANISRLRVVLIVVGIVGILFLVSYLASLYADLLWYKNLGFDSVLIKVLITKVTLFILGASIFAILGGVAIVFALRISDDTQVLPYPNSLSETLIRVVSWLSFVGVGIFSIIFGVTASGSWEKWLLLQNSVAFNLSDHVYNRDVAFYVFQLPFFEFLQNWLLGVGLVILFGSLTVIFINFGVRGMKFSFTNKVKSLTFVISGVIMIIVAFGHWINLWKLLLSDVGIVFGATYVDINARLPGLIIMIVIALFVAVLFFINSYFGRNKFFIGGILFWVVSALIFTGLWPNALQRISVNPNEFTRENEYIGRNIEYTRKAYGLDKLKETLYPVDKTISADLIRANLETIENIRLWDKGPLSSVYSFEQLIRPYYAFQEADVDRYKIGGEYRQVMLAAREVAPWKLDEKSQTWVNLKLRYTHGFGFAMSPVTDFDSSGRPEFFAGNIPSDGKIPISLLHSDQIDQLIENPRIYFGETTKDYVIANTKQSELDYYDSVRDLVQGFNYDGSGGIPISGLLNKLVYAWKLGDLNVLITGEISSDSRLLYRRDIGTRIQTVAPFLKLDGDPYIVASQGKLFWIQDAFTHTKYFPYSDPNELGFNYIRNSVKIVVDAYNGSLQFYIWDTEDPLVLAYKNMFPVLFESKDNMPDDLLLHTRYPQDLFRYQAGKYLKYHMVDTLEFYNKEDIWSLPNEKYGQEGELQPVDPYYLIMKLPGREKSEFVLLLPLTRNEPNPILAGWLAVRNDGVNYGQFVAFTFPKDRQVKGPEQIEADIDTNVDISREFTLLCQEGSDCIRGNLLIVPISDGTTSGLVYVEPIYLQAADVEFPALKKVIFATNEKVVMEDSVPDAVNSLVGKIVISKQMTIGEIEQTSAENNNLPTGNIGSVIFGLQKTVEIIKTSLDKLEVEIKKLQQEIEE